MSSVKRPYDEQLQADRVRDAIRFAADDLRVWTLFAIGLISLQVLQIVLLQAPWTDARGEGVISGWELVGGEVASGPMVALSLLMLLGSTVVTFSALRRRDATWFKAIVALSIVRAGSVLMVSYDIDGPLRYGASFTFWMLAITVVAAAGAIARASA